MREIKFKIWDVHNKLFLNRDQFNVRCDGYNGGIQANHSAGVIGGSIALQFTGLKDKNGKEIYEGDVLSDKWKVEVYQNDEGTYMVKFHTNPTQNKPLTLKNYLERRKTAGTDDVDNCIIGNIYENPELLK